MSRGVSRSTQRNAPVPAARCAAKPKPSLVSTIPAQRKVGPSLTTRRRMHSGPSLTPDHELQAEPLGHSDAVEGANHPHLGQLDVDSVRRTCCYDCLQVVLAPAGEGACNSARLSLLIHVEGRLQQRHSPSVSSSGSVSSSNPPLSPPSSTPLLPSYPLATHPSLSSPFPPSV